MITWNTYGDETEYNNIRYRLLFWVEETGKPQTAPYIVKGDATMGIGFNLTVRGNMTEILTEMGNEFGGQDT